MVYGKICKLGYLPDLQEEPFRTYELTQLSRLNKLVFLLSNCSKNAHIFRPKFILKFLNFYRQCPLTFISDFDKIQAAFKNRPTLEGKNLSITTVPVSKTILVKNLPALATYDSVFYKFENRRAGGGEIEKVDLDLEKRIALVEFKDAKGRKQKD